MSDKMRKKLGDYLEISLPSFGDRTAVISRNDVTEEQWQAAKAAAEHSGNVLTLKESQNREKNPSNVVDKEDYVDLKDPVTGVVAKMPRGDIPQARWEALKQRVSSGELKLDWQREKSAAADEAAAKAGAVAVPEANIKRSVYDAATPDSGGGTLGSKIRSLVGGAVSGATPGPTGPTGGGGVEQLPPMQGGEPPAPVDVSGQPVGSAAALQPAPGAPPAPTEKLDLTGIPEGQGRTPLDLLKSAGSSLLGPSPGAQFGDLVEAGRQSVTQPLPAAPAPAPPGPVDPTQQSLELSQKTSTPGSGGASLESDLNKAYADQARAKLDLARQETERSAEQAQLEVQKAKALDIAEQARAAKAQAILEEQNKLMAAQMRVAESLNEQLKVDPKRLWNSRTSEQKANAQLAGFLFGLAGNGMDYVRSLQQEVDRDVQLQVQQFEANRDSKVAHFNMLGTAYGQYRQQGLDANTAAEAAKASILDIHNAKLAEIAARYQGKSAGARAAEAVAALGQERVLQQNKLRDSASSRAALSAQTKLNKLAIEAKMMKAAAGSKPGALPAVLRQNLGRVDEYIVKLRRAKEMLGGGMLQRAGVVAAGVNPLGGVTNPELRAREGSYQNLRVEILKDALGALTSGDYAAAEKMLPGGTQIFSDTGPLFDELIKTAQERRAALVEQYDQGTVPDQRGPNYDNQGGD